MSTETDVSEVAGFRTTSVRREALWPLLIAIALFVIVLLLIRPWSNLPLNDDWQYAHIAKRFAEQGIFRVDSTYESKTLIGQAAIAWPVIRVFGFSHLALRLLTVCLSILMLLEIEYLVRCGGVAPGIRAVALSSLAVNPFFLYFATTFMTENYSYFVALLSACVWFYGRKRNRAWAGVVAAGIAGMSFWIRQFSALVFPALLLAEAIAAHTHGNSLQSLARRRGPAVAVWASTIAAYYVWAAATGHYISHGIAEHLGDILTPSPLLLLVESGIFVFYLTFFFAPFLSSSMTWKRPTISDLIVPGLLLLACGFAWTYGDRTGLPRASLRFVFPFLHNVMTSYGVGPITLTDVYIQNAHTRPQLPIIGWITVEALIVPLSLSWTGMLARVAVFRNEVALFGLCFALLSFVVVVLYFQFGIFDRYHYPGILGLAIAVPVLFPQGRALRLRRWGVGFVGGMAVFSTCALHDYFRWNEARAALVADARRLGIVPSQIDAGLELNAWDSAERDGASNECNAQTNWFCPGRPYRIGLEEAPSEHLVAARSVHTWLASFPPLKLLGRADSPNSLVQ